MALGKKKEDEEAATPAPESDLAPQEGETPADAEEAAEVPPAPAAAPALNENALLSMFEGSKIEVDDLSVLTDLAGDIDLSDVIEDLYTVAAALGIRRDYSAEDDLAA